MTRPQRPVVGGVVPTSIVVDSAPRPPGPPMHPPMAMRVSQADQDWIDAAIARSNQLAEARGHVNVYRQGRR